MQPPQHDPASANTRPSAAAPPAGTPKSKRKQRLLQGLAISCWLYLAGVFGVWMLFRWAGDRWWLATLLLFGPRWFWALPLLLLAPLALLFKRKLLWIHVPTTLMLLIPIMGFSVPWRTLGRHNTGKSIRVIDFNMDGANGDQDGFLRYIDKVQPDIIACEEFAAQPNILSSGLQQRGWHIDGSGGAIFFASRFPITSTICVPTVEKWRTLAAFYVVQTPEGNVNFVNLHLETPRWGLEALMQGRRSQIAPMIQNIARRWDESEEISARAAALHGPVLIAGDFNLPGDSAIFRDNWSRYQDGFAVAGFGFGYTKFTRKWGIRIDHLLADQTWSVVSSYVGPDLGSDHHPVITEVQFPAK